MRTVLGLSFVRRIAHFASALHSNVPVPLSIRPIMAKNLGRNTEKMGEQNQLSKMSVGQARALFLEKIQDRLASSGRPLSGFALEYWQALAPVDERAVDRLWKERKLRNDLDSIEKEFEAALHDALKDDIARDPSAAGRYLRALSDITSTEGVQLQAIVFAAAMKIEPLAKSDRRTVFIAAGITILVLALGAWIGIHLRR